MRSIFIKPGKFVDIKEGLSKRIWKQKTIPFTWTHDLTFLTHNVYAVRIYMEFKEQKKYFEKPIRMDRNIIFYRNKFIKV